MAVIRMQPEEVLQQKADSLQKLMVDTLSAVLRSATQTLGATLTAAADNPSDPAWRRAEAEWMAAVSGEFFPRVVEAYADAADDIHLQLVELYGGPAERVPYVANEYAMEYLTDTANRMVNTTEGTWARARAQLIQGFAEGESIEELSARLTEVTDWSRSRAATVARTEIISASNAGALAEVRSVNPDASKEWMATKDSRTREWHREADGETVLLGGTFTVGGEELDFPGDPSGRPDNIINCRCTMAFHVPKEALQVAVDDLDELPDVSDEFDPSEFMDFEFLEASASREERTFDESRVRRDHAGKFVKKDSADDTQEIRDAEITPVLTVAPSVSLVEVLQSRMPEDLREYWLRGPGAAIVGWGTTGSFRRCVSNLREHFPQDPEGLCANLYHEATGHWPGEKREK